MTSRTIRARFRSPATRSLPLCVVALLAGDVLAQAVDEESVDETAEESGNDTAAELRELPELPGLLTDAEGETGEPIGETPPPVTRLETLLEVNRRADAGRHEDALPLTEQLIRLTEEEFGEQSIETADAYAVAAGVQREAGEYQLAEENYLHAVELLRTLDGTYTALAIEPLLGLGDNYQAAGQYLNAITAYNEARTVNRRIYGLLNEGQVPILDRITDSFEALDQYTEADEQQLTILHLAERNYAEGSPEHLEGIYRYAAWLRESGRYHDERSRYAQAIRLIEDVHGEESVLLVRPLREIGNSYREQRLPDNQGMSSLRSALEILDENDAANPLLRAEVLRDIGDWDIAFSKVEPDVGVYETAWALLAGVENGDALRMEWFDQLHSVFDEPISQRGLSRSPDAVPGYVIVAFDLDGYGRTSDVRVVESDPVGFKDDAVVRAVRSWRFRPLVADGEVANREDVALRINFRYVSDEQADEAE